MEPTCRGKLFTDSPGTSFDNWWGRGMLVTYILHIHTTNIPVGLLHILLCYKVGLKTISLSSFGQRKTQNTLMSFVAQLVEHGACNARVVGSVQGSLIPGTTYTYKMYAHKTKLLWIKESAKQNIHCSKK